MTEQQPESVLRAGDAHYTAYVGPPAQYDSIGATQFSLLYALGLRAHHRLLDFGCGSLRAGRMIIPYLNPHNYFGIEPNRWLVVEGIENNVGNDLVQLKQPQFDHNDRFEADCFGVEFDYVVAQSILTHTGQEAASTALRSFRSVLHPDGLVVANFIESKRDYDGDDQWIYPGTVGYTTETIERLAVEAGLAIAPIPWYHPRARWYIMTRTAARLPDPEILQTLHGARLFDPDFRASVPDLPALLRKVDRLQRAVDRKQARIETLRKRLRNSDRRIEAMRSTRTWRLRARVGRSLRPIRSTINNRRAEFKSAVGTRSQKHQ